MKPYVHALNGIKATGNWNILKKSHVNKMPCSGCFCSKWHRFILTFLHRAWVQWNAHPMMRTSGSNFWKVDHMVLSNPSQFQTRDVSCLALHWLGAPWWTIRLEWRHHQVTPILNKNATFIVPGMWPHSLTSDLEAISAILWYVHVESRLGVAKVVHHNLGVTPEMRFVNFKVDFF